MMAKDAGEWQTYDVTLVGRLVTLAVTERQLYAIRSSPVSRAGRWIAMKGNPVR